MEEIGCWQVPLIKKSPSLMPKLGNNYIPFQATEIKSTLSLGQAQRRNALAVLRTNNSKFGILKRLPTYSL
jgi:hypothetical protein